MHGPGIGSGGLRRGGEGYSELGEAARSLKYEGYFMVEFLSDLRDGLDDLQALKRDIDFIKSL